MHALSVRGAASLEDIIRRRPRVVGEVPEITPSTEYSQRRVRTPCLAKSSIECECVRDSPLAHERDARPVREADPAVRRRKERRHRAVKQVLVDPGHFQERKQVAIQDPNCRDPDSGLQAG